MDNPRPFDADSNSPKTDFDKSGTFKAGVSNFRRLWAGQMSPEGYAEALNTRSLRNQASDIARCEKQRDYLFKYSPIIRFMREQIASLGGEIDEKNVVCETCWAVPRQGRQGGGFDPRYGIRLCANEKLSRGWMEDTLTHEMVHAWDHLRWQVDWLGEGKTGLRQAACAEIRASNLSGECRFWREFVGRQQWVFTKQQQTCVRRRAILSVMARPACKGEEDSAQAVDDVWDSCFSDTRPFDEIYR
ncbi:MAG: Mitochondrial inner membrane protease atp23 [Vezdaea aestivalis]|nr:MAG: Mitochondrial inner membrane protease atp23 [Vezdaea aestivalis]